MYAQHDEEAVIDILFPHVKAGRYVDIGAGGIADSNTYKYYQMGWSGLLVEPRPDAVEELRALRPRDIVVEAAVTNIDGEVGMHDAGDLSRLTALAPGSPVAFRCRSITMATLLEEHPEFRVVDVASIDTEGAEEMVISSSDFELFRPEVLIVEYNTAGYCSDTRGRWEAYVLPFYEPVHYNGVNGVYVRRAVARETRTRPGST